MARDDSGNWTPKVTPSEKAAPGPRQKVVLTGRDGLPAGVDDTADYRGGAQRVTDRDVLGAMAELTAEIRALKEFLMDKLR